MAKKVKIKSRSSVKKRFKITGTGKVKRNRAYNSHILTKKSRKRKRKLRQTTLVDKSQEKTIKAMLTA